MKACPFCGTENPEQVGDGKFYRLKCDECGAKGPPSNNGKAFDLWDMREPDRDWTVMRQTVFACVRAMKAALDGIVKAIGGGE